MLSAGDCILGDFGAAKPLGQLPQESTPTHWPSELESKSLRSNETSAAIDYFQLVVTLLERLDAMVLRADPHTSEVSYCNIQIGGSRAQGLVAVAVAASGVMGLHTYSGRQRLHLTSGCAIFFLFIELQLQVCGQHFLCCPVLNHDQCVLNPVNNLFLAC